MRLELGRIDHQRVNSAALIGQLQKYPGKNALIAPPFPSVA